MYLWEEIFQGFKSWPDVSQTDEKHNLDTKTTHTEFLIFAWEQNDTKPYWQKCLKNLQTIQCNNVFLPNLVLAESTDVGEIK